jgi:hypothetical protein
MSYMNIVHVVQKLSIIIFKFSQKMILAGSENYVFRSLLFQTATTSSYPVNNLLFIDFINSLAFRRIESLTLIMTNPFNG